MARLNSGVTCVCVLLALCGTAHAWQRPKLGEAFPPLRKSAGEPQLFEPALDATPVSEAPEEQAEVAELPPPAVVPALRTSAAEPPAEAAAAEKPSTVEIVGEGDASTPRLLNEPRPLRPVTSTLARAATFRGVTPGKTRREELVEAWGEPVSQAVHDEQLELEYAIEPFARIDVIIEDEIIVSMLGRYEAPVTVEAAAEVLGVAGLAPAVVRDERGRALGQYYPERGVLFGGSAVEGQFRVAQVVVEPPTAEGFLIRAEQQRRRNPQASLSDVKAALELAPENARAQALLLRMLLKADRATEAQAAAQEILQESPDNVPARITSGRASLELARFREAEREARSILERADLSPIDRASAQLLLGDVLARSPQHDVRGAMTHHHEAAQAATVAVQEATPGPAQQDALETAVEAYLAVAEDLAMGNWRRREETFAQWIAHAERVVEALAAAEVKEDWLFHVRCRALEACAASGGKIEPAPFAAAVMEMGSRLVAATPDPSRRAEFQAKLGESLLDVSQSLMIAGKHAAGRNYIFDAQRLLEAANSHHANAQTEHLLGRAYFFRGLDKAVGENDHIAAAEWYAKALPLLDRPLLPGQLNKSGAQGQRLVTMAVSLWQADQRDQAVALTEKGLRYIQDAVDRAELDRAAMTAPLTNLANMNRLLGNEVQAEKYQTRLVDFQTPVEEPKSEP
jgi:tetratricopeptide (TPR) repeat protein